MALCFGSVCQPGTGSEFTLHRFLCLRQSLSGKLRNQHFGYTGHAHLSSISWFSRCLRPPGTGVSRLQPAGTWMSSPGRAVPHPCVTCPTPREVIPCHGVQLPFCPGVPGMPAIPLKPGFPGGPVSPKTPGSPLSPGTPFMPKGPGTPASPGSPLSPGRPVQERGGKNNTHDGHTPYRENAFHDTLTLQQLIGQETLLGRRM